MRNVKMDKKVNKEIRSIVEHLNDSLKNVPGLV